MAGTILVVPQERIERKMAVNLSKNNLCINQIIEQKNEKITIDGDEIVPDVKPDV